MRNFFLSIFISLVFFICNFSDVNAQNGIVELKIPSFLSDTILTGYSNIEIKFTNNTGNSIQSFSNGFVLSSPNGATWEYTNDPVLGAAPTGWLTTEMFPAGLIIIPFSLDGNGSDTIGLIGNNSGTGIPNGFDEIVAYLEIYIPDSEGGKVFCIDSAWFPPTGTWNWSGTANYVPELIGNGCYDISSPLNEAVIITNCPYVLSFNYCDLASYDFDAYYANGDPVTFIMLDGPGSINTASGLWSYQPSAADIGQSIVLEIAPSVTSHTGKSCTVDLIITGNPPQFVSGCYENLLVCKPYVNHKFTAEPEGCNPFTYSIIDIIPPADSVTIDPVTGLIYVPYLFEYFDMVFTVTVGATDGISDITCLFTFDLIKCDVYGDMDGDGSHSISDLTKIVDFMFRGGPAPFCLSMADTNGDDNVNVVDITFLVDYLFRTGPPPPDCQ